MDGYRLEGIVIPAVICVTWRPVLAQQSVETLRAQTHNLMQTRRWDERSRSHEHESANVPVMGQEHRKTNEADMNRNIGS